MECELCGQEMDPCGLARLICAECWDATRRDAIEAYAVICDEGAWNRAMMRGMARARAEREEGGR